VRVRADVQVFDFSSLISESSFFSMVKAVAPRNLVLLQVRAGCAHFPLEHVCLQQLVLVRLLRATLCLGRRAPGLVKSQCSTT
jgi:hypothetical protein